MVDVIFYVLAAVVIIGAVIKIVNSKKENGKDEEKRDEKYQALHLPELSRGSALLCINQGTPSPNQKICNMGAGRNGNRGA